MAAALQNPAIADTSVLAGPSQPGAAGAEGASATAAEVGQEWASFQLFLSPKRDGDKGKAAK